MWKEPNGCRVEQPSAFDLVLGGGRCHECTSQPASQPANQSAARRFVSSGTHRQAGPRRRHSTILFFLPFHSYTNGSLYCLLYSFCACRWLYVPCTVGLPCCAVLGCAVLAKLVDLGLDTLWLVWLQAVITRSTSFLVATLFVQLARLARTSSIHSPNGQTNTKLHVGCFLYIQVNIAKTTRATTFTITTTTSATAAANIWLLLLVSFKLQLTYI